MEQKQPRNNRLGAGGWVWAGNYKMERYLYLLHRITALGLILYGVLHLTATTFFRIQGQGVWEATMAFVHNPWFKAGEYLVVLAFAFHALNGLRLILQEFGFVMGKPGPVVYPYKDTLRRKRPFAIAIIAVIGLVAVVFLYDFVAGGW
jgi:succinate dehydrogenase / fumarate reductase cytochrome b subunit